MSSKEVRGFRTWEELLDYLRSGRPIYYRVRVEAQDVDGDRVIVHAWNPGDFDEFTVNRPDLAEFGRPT